MQAMSNWPRVIGLLALTAAISSCSLYFSNLRIANGSDSRVTDVLVSNEGKTWKLGDLDRGQHATFTAHLSGEGGPNISWIWHGKRFSADSCYFTQGMQAKGTVTIFGEKLNYRCG